MAHANPINQSINFDASKMLPLHFIECAILDDTESMTDGEIENYVSHL